MNKDKKWLLREFRKLTFELQYGHAKVKAVDILPLIDQLDETKKAVIPQFVADWIIQAKKFGYSIGDSIGHVSFYLDTDQYDKAMRWARYNQNIFARAWLDGYEIEKEKLYYVLNKQNETLLVLIGEEVCISSGCKIHNGNKDMYQLTEKQIKDYDLRYWVFAVEVTK